MDMAYITLLTSENFLKAVLVLNRNLKELKCQYPLVVMVTENLAQSYVLNYLNKEQIQYIIVPVIQYPEATLKTMPERLTTIASKLNVLNLKQFNRVVYLDADAIFFNNIDDLFGFPDGSLYDESLFYEDGGPVRGFCGLFVCEPPNHVFQHYLTILQNEVVWESDIIEELWFPYNSNINYHIPSKYFVNFMVQNMDNYFASLNEINGVHFCSQYKPWMYKNKYQFWADMFKQHPISIINNRIRDDILSIYFNYYLEPLKKDYPELFKEDHVNEITNSSSTI